MLIQYRKKIYQIPPPASKEAEVLIKVQKYAFVPVPEGITINRFAYHSTLFKVFFFLMHEGIRLTLNKVMSRLLQKRMISEKKIIFVYGRVNDTDNYAIALGPQDCPYSEYLSFPEELTVKVSEKSDLMKEYQKVLNYLSKDEKSLISLYHYSPHSGRRPNIKLLEVLNEGEGKEISVLDSDLKTLHLTQQETSRASKRKIPNPKSLKLFLAGAGAYACSYILPYLKDVDYHTVIDINPILASFVGEKYNFSYRDTSTGRALETLKGTENPILIVATHHSTHLPVIEEALSNNPSVKIFLEKPPVTTEGQLKRLIELRENDHHFIEIGYNRRHSPFVKKAKEFINRSHGPVTMTCIVKELSIPLSHWYYWPNQGTRVTGNLSHWIDLGVYFIEKSPVSITAISASDTFPADEVSVAIVFDDGSLLTLIASDRGNELRGVQEYIDIRRGDLTITIDNFWKMTVQMGGRQKIYRRLLRDKGHKRMYKNFMHRIEKGKGPAYTNKDLAVSTSLYLGISDMLLSGEKYGKLN